MKFLFFLIFILAISGTGLFSYYKYDKNISAFQRDNHLLKSQLLKLKEKYDLLNNYIDNFTIEFLTVDNHYGLLKENSAMYLYPDENSYILQTTTTNMEVAILEKVIINNSTWYYVALPIDSNINCRGWIKESAFSSLSFSPIEIDTKQN